MKNLTDWLNANKIPLNVEKAQEKETRTPNKNQA